MIILNGSLQLLQIRRSVMMLLSWIEQVAGFFTLCMYFFLMFGMYAFLVYRYMIACVFVVTVIVC
jgi:hypothetical protein